MAETEQLLNRAASIRGRSDNVPEELLIDVSPFESRVALVKDGAVEEVHLARAAGYTDGQHLSGQSGKGDSGNAGRLC